MAKFEHRRYPALTLQDERGVWAQFSPEDREFGEAKIRVGVLETDDEAVIGRLRAGSDSDLVEIGGSEAKGPKRPQANSGAVPTGSIAEILAWVGDDKVKAEQALGAEMAKGDKARSTLIADLEQIAE